MVSIMPGIEARAPERTETRSGFSLSPKVAPIAFSMNEMAGSTSSLSRATTRSRPRE